MNEIIRSTRVTRILEVLQLVNDGKTVKDACSEKGLARSSFYYIMQTHMEEIFEYQNLVLASSLERLAILLGSQFEILQKVIDDALAETTTPRDRLKIYKALQETRDKLEATLRISRQSSPVVSDFLKGPKLEPGISRLGSGVSVMPDVSELPESVSES